MRELSDIKDEIFRLNRKIDQKSIEMRVPLTTRTKTNKINFDSNGVSSKANRDYRKSPKTWRNNKIGAKSHSTRHKELYPLWFNDKGRLIERKEEKSALKTNKVNRNIPLYLKNVQSKILPQIEKDKLEYNMKEHFTNPNKLANAEKEINEQIENGEDNDKIMNHQEDASPSKSQSESVSKSQSKSQSQVEENNENSQEDAESDLLTLGRKDVRFADIADKYLDNKIINYFSNSKNEQFNSTSEQLPSQESNSKHHYASDLQPEKLLEASNSSPSDEYKSGSLDYEEDSPNNEVPHQYNKTQGDNEFPPHYSGMMPRENYNPINTMPPVKSSMQPRQEESE